MEFNVKVRGQRVDGRSYCFVSIDPESRYLLRESIVSKNDIVFTPNSADDPIRQLPLIWLDSNPTGFLKALCHRFAADSVLL